MIGKILRALVIFAFIGVLAPLAATPAGAAACTGTGPIEITSLTFSPAVVAPGQSSTATMVAQNCTDQPVSTVSIWSGRYAGTTIPPGCPVIDPVGLPANFAPLGQVTSRLTYLILSSCTATALTATVSIQVNGGTPAIATATVQIQPSARTCQVAYKFNEWRGGFSASVTITNTGASTINSWQLNFTFPGDQRITNFWNAAITQTGAAVTARNVSYNATIAPNASVTLGFNGTWTTSDAPPTAFTLNGAPCTTG